MFHVDLLEMIAKCERHAQFSKAKWEKAELEKDLAVAKETDDIKIPRGWEVWLYSFLENCYTSLNSVCKELNIERIAPEKSTTGYVSWIKGASTQLSGIGQRIDRALKEECRRAISSRVVMYSPVSTMPFLA